MHRTAPAGLTRSQYAAVRAWLQGVPVAIIARRWLSPDFDNVPSIREALKILRTARDAMALLARQNDREDIAIAVRSPLRSSISLASAIEALRQLETLCSPAPLPDHSLHVWMATPLAHRLQRSGLMTLGDLMAFCNRSGHGWYRQIPRVGRVAADHVVRFLSHHASSLGELGPHVTGTLPAAQAAAVSLEEGGSMPAPLESFRPPPSLDGRCGSNRAPISLCLISARDDNEAVQAWISRWPAGSQTCRCYRKEAERFLAWSIIEQGRALSDVRPSDCVAYCRFLVNPAPAARWCGPRAPREILVEDTRISNPAWRPFTGPLSTRSRLFSQTVLTLLCAWLTDCRYLATNPWDGIPDWGMNVTAPKCNFPLPHGVWEAMKRWLDEQAYLSARGRLWRAAVLLLSETGMNCEDASMAEAIMPCPPNGFESSLQDEGPMQHTLIVRGEDGEGRRIPISGKLRDALVSHWADRYDHPGKALAYLPWGSLPPRAKKSILHGDRGYSPRGIRALIEQAAESFSRCFDLTGVERHKLACQIRPRILPQAHILSGLSSGLTAADTAMRISIRRRSKEIS